jgi:protein involved in polysaccharide export with SLBB domain
MRGYILILLLGLAALRSAGQTPTPLSGPVVPVPTVGTLGNPQGSAVMNGYMQDATYKLRAGDVVSFQIREDLVWDPGDSPKDLTVSDSGELDVPYLGRVLVVDKTCPQLANELKVALEKDYYNKATVVLSLNLANRVAGRIYITGMVRNPGPQDMQLNENLTASQAILRAGGFADFANKAKVKVVRGVVGSHEGKKTFDLDMEQIMEGKTENDIVLQPGDFIIVPTKQFNF